MTQKIYKVRISFGDGNPMEDSIVARSGMLAQDIAMRRHPGARNVHLIGVDNRYEKSAPVAVRREIPAPGTDMANWDRDTQIRCCTHLYKEGHSQRSIAGYLGVSRSTVARWIKQYG